jgi:predicted DsbA family dithiol-disulfide isomerase
MHARLLLIAAAASLLAATGCGGPTGAIASGTFAAAAAEDTAFLTRVIQSRVFGSSDAPHLVYEVTDYSCPTCMRFYTEKSDSLKAQLVSTGQVQLVHVTSPLPQLLRSWHGASAALCAGGLGGQPAYLRMQHELFTRQEEWRHLGDPLPMFVRMAERAGVPGEALRTCVQENRVAPVILSDLRSISELRARGLDIPGTPTFVVDERESFYGVQPIRAFRDALERSAAGAPPATHSHAH